MGKSKVSLVLALVDSGVGVGAFPEALSTFPFVFLGPGKRMWLYFHRSMSQAGQTEQNQCDEVHRAGSGVS